MNVLCDITTCFYNDARTCIAKTIRLIDIDSEEFNDEIEDITVSPFLRPQVENAILICMNFIEAEPREPIRKSFEGSPEKISPQEKKPEESPPVKPEG